MPGHKKQVFLTFSVMTAIVIAAVILLSSHINSNNYIATVNGEPIQEREFLAQLYMETAGTYEYFRQKYNAAADGDFWNTDFNGEIPIQYARNEALKKCIDNKVQQILAKKYGLIDDITYSAFLKSLEKENKKRKEALKNTGVIYGPQQYDENSYFLYTFSNMVIKLKEKLQESQFRPGDEELMDFYEKAKDTLYKNQDTIKFQVISIAYGEAGGALDETKRKEVENEMLEIKTRADKGENFENISKSDPGKIKVETREINNTTASVYSKTEPILFETANKLNENQQSDVLDENIQRKVEVIRILYKEEAGYKDFDAYKESVLLNYTDTKYRELIGKLNREAKVEINNDVYLHTKIQFNIKH